MRRLVAILVLVALSGCTREDAARETLEGEGFKQVVITGWAPFSCSDSDSTCTAFEATGPSGRRVTGAVGCGWFLKGCTVRVSP